MQTIEQLQAALDAAEREHKAELRRFEEARYMLENSERIIAERRKALLNAMRNAEGATK